MKTKAAECRYHIIYTIKRDDGYFYKGMHSTNNLDDGYVGSGIRIKAWIKKYGIDEFWKKHIKSIDELLPDRKSLEEREASIVNESLLSNPLCLNLCQGGSGGSRFTGKTHSEEARRKCGEASRNHIRSSEHKRKISEGLKGKQNFLGHTHTEETKEQMRETIRNSEKRKAFCRPCTLDGITIYESRKAMRRALGAGKNGINSPLFRFIDIPQPEVMEKVAI